MRTPQSTYRLQITEDFDLIAAAKTLSYLHELGVDWVYLSPLLASESGSDHGYDVADHSAIDPSRGRAAGLSTLATEARRLGMGVLVDIVPNHVGVARPWENDWWWHVLTHGQNSAYAEAFDIDWAFGEGKVRLPVVAEDDLEPDGRIRGLQVLGGELHYRDQRFPLAPDSMLGISDDANLVHSRQHYQLVGWRQADRMLNYRRFFAVNSLVAIRVEDPVWFTRSHAEIKRWFDEGLVDGLRVDHPDGLRDPGKYLDDLAALTGGAYVLVEKILATRIGADGELLVEELPASWKTAGTTGYDAMALIDRVLVDAAGEPALTALEERLRGRPDDWPRLVHDSKLGVAHGLLAAEVVRIARDLAQASDSLRALDQYQVAEAIAEIVADFEVYRTYLPEGREYLEQAFGLAWEHRPDLGPVLNQVYGLLADGASAPAQRFQQTSGMVMAKAVEDGAHYRTSRLTSLNEVGGDPSLFAIDVEQFHTAMLQRQSEWPTAMVAGTTHDTKRGEGTRARISVLAEVPQLWDEALSELLALVPVPDVGLANLLWQAIIGVWPAERARLRDYATKAMREAGEHTCWTDPDAAFEAALSACVDAAFDRPEVTAVVERVLAAVVGPGRSNSLAAKLLSLTIPGVPDVYQGSELWEHNLVDPDNRRPVDFARRAEVLSQVRLGARPQLSQDVDDLGEVKLLVTHQALIARRDHPEWFTRYRPLAASGPAADHLIAFSRGGAITVVTRLPVGLAASGGWRDTTVSLPEGRWRDVISGRLVAVDRQRQVPVAHLLERYPVALLVREQRRTGERGRFDVWAPLAQQVRLQVGDRVVAMTRGIDSWWTPAEPEPLGQVDYGYLLDDDPQPRPDPRSRWQPAGVHGLSRSYDSDAFGWHDQQWTGRSLPGSVIYELHLGTFTAEGTLDSAVARLPELVDLGIDFVELMPVNAFAGSRGWGYDGVGWFAVQDAYGGPDAYRRFVDAAHAAGLGVIQDVVYNHFGPVGNYLTRFGPYLAETDGNWGSQVNLDGPGSTEVRRFIADNIRYWFVEAHVDGLRLDAVHALHDSSPTHLLEELAMVTNDLAAHLRRPLALIAESDANDPRIITPRQAGGYGVDAVWSDDFHHALHTALTGETDGYYVDYTGLAALAKACERGFVHDGTWSSFRGRHHGAPLDITRVPGWRLVVAATNHDQVGNRPRGDRPRLSPDQHAAAALLSLTSGNTPLLFMGQEWAASTPFGYFCDYDDPELVASIRQGRRDEFATTGWDATDLPDPLDVDTFTAAKLRWEEADEPDHAAVRQAYRQLLALRRQYSELTNPVMARTRCTFDDDAGWFLMRRGGLAIAVNFSTAEVRVNLGGPHMLRWAGPSGARPEADAVYLPPHGAALLIPLEE